MKLSALGIAAIVSGIVAGPAYAGPYTDDFSKCLVAQATPQDRAILVQWIFSAVSAGPTVRELAKITPQQRTELTTQASSLFSRLMTQSCRAPLVTALKYEGTSVIETGFGVLGQVAMRDLMTQPEVQQQLNALNNNQDKDAFAAIAKEAGIAPPK